MGNPASSVGDIFPNTTMYNDNVNYIKTNNVQCNNVSKGQADVIADKLVVALNNPISRTFYCKVAYRLSESQIWNNLEMAAKGREPAKLFTWLCKNDMRL